MRKSLATLTLATLCTLACAVVAAAQTPDPGATGPYAVTREEYDYGTLAFQPSNFPSAVELKASVHHPTDMTGGPFPLIVFLHGRHSTCYRGSTAALPRRADSG